MWYIFDIIEDRGNRHDFYIIPSWKNGLQKAIKRLKKFTIENWYIGVVIFLLSFRDYILFQELYKTGF